MPKLIVANWKCNPNSLKEAEKIFNAVKTGLKNIKKSEVIICPPFIYLKNYKLQTANYKLGSQNCFYEEKGAFTGEISVKMLKDIGAKYIIVGHSERRRIFEETDEVIGKKIQAVVKENLVPIFCVGETKEEKQKNLTFQTLEEQIKIGLKDIPIAKVEKIIIAYEPIWAIGTGIACSLNNALTSILFIRKVISKIFNQKTAKNIKILYGGSVNSTNSNEYLKEKEISGLLVGGASLNPVEFLKIARN